MNQSVGIVPHPHAENKPYPSRVYLTAPAAVQDLPIYDYVRACIDAHFPDASVRDSRALYGCKGYDDLGALAAWCAVTDARDPDANFAQFLTDDTLLVYFTPADNWYPPRIAREIAATRAAGGTVTEIVRDGTLRSLESAIFTDDHFILPASAPVLRNAPPAAAIRTHLTGNVYLASSLSTYRAPRYDRMLNASRAHFPQARVRTARSLFTSNQEWRARWPAVLTSSTALVFFVDAAGYIGKGVYQEIHDADMYGIPVWFLTDDGTMYDLNTLSFTVDEDDWKQYARVHVAKGVG